MFRDLPRGTFVDLRDMFLVAMYADNVRLFVMLYVW